MLNRYFREVAETDSLEGKDSKNPLAFKYYDKNKRVGNKTMAEHLRFSVAYWHTMMGDGSGHVRRSEHRQGMAQPR